MVLRLDEPQSISYQAQLISEFARGNGSVFVGAGLSSGAGLPNWEELIRPLGEEINCPDSASFLDIAQYYVNMRDLTTFRAYVTRALSKRGVKPTDVHRELLKLPVSRIFTTNLDHLLEDAFEEQCVEFIPIVTDEDLAAMDRSKKSIVKLHGDLRIKESWVLTSEQYEAYFDERPGIANLLGMDLHSRAILFLGYSFNDFDMRMIFSRVSRKISGLRKNLFAIQFDPTDLEKEALGQRNIRVIGLPVGPEGKNYALKRWLVNFIRRVRESPELQNAARPLFIREHIGNNLPPLPDGLLERLEDRDRLMRGLQLRYPLISIKGVAGAGKTTLANEIGWICSQNCGPSRGDEVIFEYIIWIPAKDKPAQKLWLNDVLNEIAKTTDHPVIMQLPFETQQQRDDKVEQVKALLGCYRILIIIDNFETIHDHNLIDWLEHLPFPSKAIITSRSEAERIAAWSMNLGGLTTGEATELLRQHETLVEGEEEVTLQDLARGTKRNPQAMKLSLGLVRAGICDLKEAVQRVGTAGGRPERIFQVLFSIAWERISDSARGILLSTPLFVGVSSIREDALSFVSGAPVESFRQGLQQCLELSLLEAANKPGRYVIHSKTRDFARQQLDKQSDWERAARTRCIEYFLEFVREKVERPRPKQLYWNALVDIGMEELDPEWPSIQQVLAWTDEDGQEDALVELVMLLVHYMDSRFKNLERLKYVEKVVAILHDKGEQEKEALLRIDALGWTYVEELKLREAERQISRGYNMALGKDLRALGLAWSAREKVEREEQNFELADKLILEARNIAREHDCSPWIRFRVNMAAGDIELKRMKPQAALDYYRRAAKETKSYGGEGGGYQTKPRIGLAYLGMGETKKAEQTFKALSRLKRIPIAKLYAEYGLALVEREKGHQSEALLMLTDVKAKINRYTRSGSNLLLRLIEEQEARMAGS